MKRIMTTLGDLKWHDRQIHLYLPITTIRCGPTVSSCKNFNSSGRDILYRYSKLDDKGTRAILANRQAYVCVHPYSLLPSRDIWTTTTLSTKLHWVSCSSSRSTSVRLFFRRKSLPIYKIYPPAVD